jgi:hypothetical protein
MTDGQPDSLPPVVVREGLLRRVAPTAPSRSALATVHERLALATTRMEEMGDGGRYGVALAMNALLDYFASVGLPYATLAPIEAVMAAIVDARRGIESEIFKRDRSRKGAPPTSARKLTFEGHLAFIAECCIRHTKLEGKRPYVELGCRLAERLISKSRWTIKPSATELRELRERVMQRNDTPDRLVFQLHSDSDFFRTQPLVLAKSLLQHDWVNQIPA